MRNLNKPPRYNVASIQAQQTLGGDVMESSEKGKWVEWLDYTWLLAEKQRLDDNEKELNEDINRLRDRYAEATQENARLKAERDAAKRCWDSMKDEWDKLVDENIRLRKAGDAMAHIIAPPTHGTGEWDGEWDAWQEAKEGKQS